MDTSPSLLRQLRSKKDSVAWSRFVASCTPLVDQWIGLLGFREPDRSDLVQEVFLVVLGKVSSFQYDGSRRGNHHYMFHGFRLGRAGINAVCWPSIKWAATWVAGWMVGPPGPISACPN